MISARMINNGRRLHLQHGPIDLIIEAFGDNIACAYNAAIARFETLLQELVDELPQLRSATAINGGSLHGSVAKRMLRSAAQFPDKFTTPMIAVAGSVADEILQTMCDSTSLNKACVNNGGDIAVYLAEGQTYKAGVVSNPQKPDLPATITLSAADGIGGIATSGRHGRSLSLGIADSVTVTARNASLADAAATLVANAVTIANSKSVSRVPAEELDPDTDLAGALVTVDVKPLNAHEIDLALGNGVAYANELYNRQLISGAFLTLQGVSRTVRGTAANIVMPLTFEIDKRIYSNA
jgi:ApbE superfamily uncharacterized protein (UPF0280 family)